VNSDVATAQTLHRRRLARHHVAVDSVRSAVAFGATTAEIAVFETDHVYVAACSSGEGAMLPRPMHPAETALRAAHCGDSDSAVVQPAPGEWVAVPICDAAGQLVAALSARFDDPPSSLGGLRSLARFVESELATDAVEDDDFVHAVLEGQRDAVLVLTSDLTIRYVSRGVSSLLGLTPNEAVGRSAADFLHPDDIETTLHALTRLSQGLEMWRVSVRLLNSGGLWVPVEVTGNDLCDDPVVGGLVVSLRDAQHDKEIGLAMDRTQRLSEAIVGGLRDGVIATDEFGAITTINNTARDMFDIDADRVPAQLRLDDFGLVDLDGRPVEVLARGTACADVSCLVSQRGEVRYLRTSHQPIHGGGAAELGTVVVFSDVTAEFLADEALRNQALHDQLTGLPNRRQLDARLVDLASTRSDKKVAACFIDLDDFKAINEMHGHRSGDEMVRLAARRLAGELREHDLLVRQGGDEFVALLVGVESLDIAAEIAERCRRALHAPYAIGGDRFHVTGSIGVAISTCAELDGDLLLQHADLALYAAKDGGRNRVECFDAELAAAARVEESQRRLLRDALEEDRLVMHFQPLVDSTTERVVGYESLARIRDLDGEILGPGAFLDAISGTPLVWELDRAAFELSCQAATLLARIDPKRTPYIACNFGAISINHPDFVAFVVDTVERAGIAPAHICLELTESAAFDGSGRGAIALEDLGSRGFQLALDDFGTGYSSLSHMRDLPITSIKVDRSFISRLGLGANEHSIAGAIAQLAGELAIGVVAEGVETSDQLRHAQDLGFHTIQGFYYSRAIPLTECLQNWAETSHYGAPVSV